MGLDCGDLIMEIEKKFEISIKDSELYEADTVGKLANVVYSRLKKDIHDPCPSQQGFYFLRKLLIEHYDLLRAEVMPETRLEDIIPKTDRRKSWRSFVVALTGDPRNLKLRLSKWGSIVTFYLGPLFVFLLFLIVFPLALFWFGLMAAFITAWLLDWLLTPLKIKIPKEYSAIKDLIPYITTKSMKVWNKEEVYEEIKTIIAELFDIKPILITPNSHIIIKLGLD